MAIGLSTSHRSRNRSTCEARFRREHGSRITIRPTIISEAHSPQSSPMKMLALDSTSVQSVSASAGCVLAGWAKDASRKKATTNAIDIW